MKYAVVALLIAAAFYAGLRIGRISEKRDAFDQVFSALTDGGVR